MIVKLIVIHRKLLHQSLYSYVPTGVRAIWAKVSYTSDREGPDQTAQSAFRTFAYITVGNYRLNIDRKQRPWLRHAVSLADVDLDYSRIPGLHQAISN